MVVSLSASGKTARGFAWQVITKRAQGSGPLSFSQVTHVPDTVGGVVSRPAHIPSGVFKYSQLDSAVDVAAGVKPQKLVIVDFGARQNALKKFMGLVNEKPELKGAQTVILQFEANKRFKSSFPIFTSQGKKKKKKANCSEGILDRRSPRNPPGHAAVWQNLVQHCRHPG